ncbi:DNA polymerase II [Aliikangiella sp. G2MR2-5]|uniref:DNA polymerase II n=1 Tax=Aliikangiella sp. G2MR2-5 TaxID=2788943 RepID=UPI0018A9D6EB|nr:DNA polymerase II [Aliikangiella sp. G2MR2-5]
MSEFELKSGFILSKRSFDLNKRAAIRYWLSTADGPLQIVIETEKPMFMVESVQYRFLVDELKQEGIPFLHKEPTLKTFKQEPVTVVYFYSYKDFYNARTIAENISVTTYESHIRMEDRFLMERFIYGSLNLQGCIEKRKGYFYCLNPRVKRADYTPELKKLSIDIECSEDEELFSIGFYCNSDNVSFEKVLMIASAAQASCYTIIPDFVEWVADEKVLLKRFVEIVSVIDPDVIVGWNVINFDFRVLHFRALSLGLDLKLGRNGGSATWVDSKTNKGQGYIDIPGRVVVDGISALKAESYLFPNYSLENVAQYFLGEGKSIDNVNERLEKIMRNFKENKVELATYNLKDCELVWRIFEKTNVLDFLIFRSKLTGLVLDRAGGSVESFNNLYLPKLHRNGYVSPNLPQSGGLVSPGGYVMDSKPGLYENVIVLDFKSLYPSIIKTFKIDPYGLVEGTVNETNAIEGFKGAKFDRDENILPQIIAELWEQREKAKKAKDSAKSQAIKILMNSFYGVLGSGGCPFYDPKLASSITMRGHWIMKWTAQWLEKAGYEVLYGDTDSIFVLLDSGLARENCIEIGERLKMNIDAFWKAKLEKEYQIVSFLEIEFETLFSKFFMPTIRGAEKGSKKRYAGLTRNGRENTLIFKGLENVRTDWTQIAREFQFQLYWTIFEGKSPVEVVEETVNAIYSGQVDEKLVYQKRLRKQLEEYKLSVPPHVKAALKTEVLRGKEGKKPLYTNLGSIHYYITINGPEDIAYVSSPIDYQHYIDKQIKPIADAILPFVNLEFDEIVNRQYTLFNDV